jgi:hypothetical protein
MLTSYFLLIYRTKTLTPTIWSDWTRAKKETHKTIWILAFEAAFAAT